ncbi:MAG: extracellular solute-binding protein [Oscillospiraceae bacterium]|nr:extracellular solute-binding protein [Oscillospiraceae bacterium]
MKRAFAIFLAMMMIMMLVGCDAIDNLRERVYLMLPEDATEAVTEATEAYTESSSSEETTAVTTGSSSESSDDESVQLTYATEEADGVLAAAGITLPSVEETEAAGTTIKWFSWYDYSEGYSGYEILDSGYWTFENDYGCSIDWVECTQDTRYDELATLILASDSPDYYPAESEVFPTQCVKGMFAPVDDYINYDDPLWEGVKEYAYSYYSLNDRPYMIIYDNTFGNIIIYNRRIIEEWGYDDPAELFYNDEWTWDIFYEICIDFTDADEGRYALGGNYSALMHSCGETIVQYNTETGQFESNIDSAAIEGAAALLYDLASSDCLYPISNSGLTASNGVLESGCLFYIGEIGEITGTAESLRSAWGDISEGEIMFVPLPRDGTLMNYDDDNYCVEFVPTGYCIVQGASNPEGVALLASCMRYKTLDPTSVSIERIQLEETYGWTDEMLEMYDKCCELARASDGIVAYNSGYGDELYTVVNAIESFATSSNVQTWSTVKNTYSAQLESYVNELNSQIASYDPYAFNSD